MSSTGLHTDPLAGLAAPHRRPAQIDTDGNLTFGNHGDGSPAHIALRKDARTRHTTVVGASGSGKTMLLHSILCAAGTAGVPAEVIDSRHGDLRELGHAVHPAQDAHEVLREQVALAGTRAEQARPGAAWPLQLLIIDGLDVLGDDRPAIETLGRLSAIADRAGLAVVLGSQAVTRDLFGRPSSGDRPRRTLTQNLLVLRTFFPGTLLAAGLITEIPARFGDGTSTAGLGHLRGSTALFRAWMP